MISCGLAINRLSEREYGMKRSIVRLKRVEEEMIRGLDEVERESRIVRYWRGALVGEPQEVSERRIRGYSTMDKVEVPVSIEKLIEQKKKKVELEREVGNKIERLKSFKGLPAVSFFLLLLLN